MHIGDQGASRTADGQILIAAWLGWRGDALLPSRADMKPGDIARILPRVNIIDAQAPDAFIFRLCGTYTFETTGIDLTGMNYIDMAAPEMRQRRSQRLWSTVSQPCGNRSLYAFQTRNGLPAVSEILALPLRQEDPAAPLQLITVTGLLDESQMQDVRWHGVSLSPLQHVADDFEFIDIGAGVPATPA